MQRPWSENFVWPHAHVICVRAAFDTDGRKTARQLTNADYPGGVTLVPATTPDQIPAIRDLVHPFAQLTVFAGKRREMHEQLDNPKQVACYVSHMKLWEKCAQSGIPLLILEQDAYSSPFETELRELPRAAAGADMVTLVSYDSSLAEPDPTTGVLRVSFFVGGCAYYITPAAARSLLKFALPILMHQDLYVSSLVELGVIRMHATSNFKTQRMISSDLEHQMPVIQELKDQLRGRPKPVLPAAMTATPGGVQVSLVVVLVLAALASGWFASRYMSRRQ